MDTTYPVLGDTSITVLPCALPQPSLNFVVLSTDGVVLGNFTSYRNERDQELTLDSTALFNLNWTIQYRETEESLVFQVNLLYIHIHAHFLLG